MTRARRVALAGDHYALTGADDGGQVHAGELIGVDAAFLDQHLVAHLGAVLRDRIGHADQLRRELNQTALSMDLQVNFKRRAPPFQIQLRHARQVRGITFFHAVFTVCRHTNTSPAAHRHAFIGGYISITVQQVTALKCFAENLIIGRAEVA